MSSKKSQSKKSMFYKKKVIYNNILNGMKERIKESIGEVINAIPTIEEKHTQIYKKSQDNIYSGRFHYNSPEMLRDIISSYSYEQMYKSNLSRTTSFAMKRWLQEFVAFLKSNKMQYSSTNLWKELETGQLDRLLLQWNNLSKKDKILQFERIRNATHQEGLVISIYFGWESEAIKQLYPKYYEKSVDPSGARQETINEYCRRKEQQFFENIAYIYNKNNRNKNH